ncbi:MAG: glucose-6-phosphate dehydrogenase [Holophagales bacterium]|nr:glucose-6-phosphate dehydrogenase [Holophagales bacterium]
MSQNAQPFDMIIIGASGDLARRKLVPALYNLQKHGALPEGRIFAVARHTADPDRYLEELRHSVVEQVDDGFDAEEWQRFATRFSYLEMSATDPSTFGQLIAALTGETERVRVFYLATPPSLYGDISQTLADVGAITPRTRIVLEKPIGSDLESARQINRRVGHHFREEQIYRIDHYLGKETVQNLMALRFSNALFEPLWRSEHIDHVQITVAETLGVEGRGAYYDKAGALRDMVQNHLLQLLCLTAMEPPARLDQDAIREEKIKVLRSLRPMTLEDVRMKTVRAQYRAGVVQGKETVGYTEEEGIDTKTATETYVALKAEIDNWRWAGVPFYLRTGKRMGHRVSEIIIQFKKVPHLLFTGQEGVVQENRLVIRLQPDESIKLWLMIKKPGSKLVLKRTHLNLNLADAYDEDQRAPLAYERLLMDVIRGNATLFMHRQEVEEAWRWGEPILHGWEQLSDRPRIYSAGSWGPAESIALVVRDERVWLEHLV